MRACRIAPLLFAAAVLAPGCGKPKPPAVVPVEGTVYLDGKPLPFAQIEFVPELKYFGAEMNSTGVSDENGHYTVTCLFQEQPGAAVASHRVIITEYTPEDARGVGEDAQTRLTEYLSKLTNRPIPRIYGAFTSTPVTVEVKEGQSTYDLQLSRSATSRPTE